MLAKGSCFHALGPNWWDQIYHQPAGHDLPLHQRPKRIAEAGNGDVLPQLKKLRLSEARNELRMLCQSFLPSTVVCAGRGWRHASGH
eukprot:g24367.t1